jgi:radical SAM-linked protein
VLDLPFPSPSLPSGAVCLLSRDLRADLDRGERALMGREKFRIRFRKDGDLRLVSHHDLMRCFERMLRRAALPFSSTQGFNPKPRLVFALSLGLGIVGCQEVVELELDAELTPQELHHRLAEQAPAGLTILHVSRIDPRQTAQVRRVVYRLPVPAGRLAEARPRLAELLASDQCWIERSRPQPRRVNIRPYLLDLRCLDEALEIDLLVTPGGTARPDELLRHLGLGDQLDQGAVLERTVLELDDEIIAPPREPRPPAPLLQGSKTGG